VLPLILGFWDYLRQRAQNASTEVTPLREDQQGQYSAANLRSKMLPIHMQRFRLVSESAKMPGIGRAFFVSAEGSMNLEPRNTFLGAKYSVYYPEKGGHDSPVPWRMLRVWPDARRSGQGLPEDKLEDILLAR
jgi:hypothetical protein